MLTGSCVGEVVIWFITLNLVGLSSGTNVIIDHINLTLKLFPRGSRVVLRWAKIYIILSDASCWPETDFIYVYMSSSLSYFENSLPLILIRMIQSGRKFAHVTTAELSWTTAEQSWHMRNCHLTCSWSFIKNIFGSWTYTLCEICLGIKVALCPTIINFAQLTNLPKLLEPEKIKMKYYENCNSMACVWKQIRSLPTSNNYIMAHLLPLAAAFQRH